MSYDLDYPCVACNDPAPRGWHYCVKCHLWHAGRDFYDGYDYYQRLHPALAWLDRQRRDRQGKHDPLESLVRTLLRRIDELEQAAIPAMNDRLHRFEYAEEEERNRRFNDEQAEERKKKELQDESDTQ